MNAFESANNMGLSPRNYAKLIKKLRTSEDVPADNGNTAQHRGINSEPISEAQRQEIREALKIQNRKRRKRIGWYLAIVFPIAVILLLTTFKDFEFGFPSSFGPVVDEAQQKKLKIDLFHFYLADGDSWLERGRYHNATFQYKKAIELYPNDYTGYYWLAVAYSYQCQNEQSGCITGKSLVRSMQIQFPNSEHLEKTLSIYEPWNAP
ncbi:MAG: tetratricopeptide repeat protein [Flavobacteriaceae bacterium]|nr:tetratricopeptide repeat protein [Flavobacteriaceae bacterium]